jgi:hypothetical protein
MNLLKRVAALGNREITLCDELVATLLGSLGNLLHSLRWRIVLSCWNTGIVDAIARETRSEPSLATCIRELGGCLHLATFPVDVELQDRERPY